MQSIIQTRAAKAIAARHPDTVPMFRAAMGAVFSMWTALELALFHQWGGAQGGAVAAELQDELMALFIKPDRVYKDDVSLILEDFMETRFSVILEDGSGDEIGELLSVLWRKCADGDFSMAQGIHDQALRRNAAPGGVVQQSQGLDGGDAMDSDDDDDDSAADFESNQARLQEGFEAAASAEGIPTTVFKMGGGAGGAGGAGYGAAMGMDTAMDAAMQEEEAEEEAPPLVDEEGFERVVVGKAKKGAKAKGRKNN